MNIIYQMRPHIAARVFTTQAAACSIAAPPAARAPAIASSGHLKRLAYVQLDGLVPYAAGLRLQRTLVERLIARQEQQQRARRDGSSQEKNDETIGTEVDAEEVLLLLQHPPTYTAGRRQRSAAAGAHSDASVDQASVADLRRAGAEFHETLRGGQTTFHGPGQLVGYPILDLKNYRPSVKWYACSLEKMLIDTCWRYNIPAHRSEHVGVWVGDRKIAALGVHVLHHVTSHGFALNCTTDLSWFDKIVPCGITDKGVTSIHRELTVTSAKKDPEASSSPPASDVNSVVPVLLEEFGRVFDREMVPLATVDPSLWQQIQQSVATQL